MATDHEQCSYQFKSPFYPGESCEDIYNMNPESHDRPGYYRILRKCRMGGLILDHLVRAFTKIILKLLTSQDPIVLVTVTGPILLHNRKSLHQPYT